MAGSIDPRCEIFRGTHWPVEVARLYGTRVAENHLGQRSSDRINRPDIWMQAIRSDQKKLLWHGGRPHMDASDPIRPEKTLVARGPSTYGCKRSDQTRKNSCGTGAVQIWIQAIQSDAIKLPCHGGVPKRGPSLRGQAPR